MSETKIFKIKDASTHERGDGVITTVLVTKEKCGSRITSGLTSFPVGKEVPVHCHNCDEQVVLLEGECNVEIAGELRRYLQWIQHILKPVRITGLLILVIQGRLFFGLMIRTQSLVLFRGQEKRWNIYLVKI